MEMKPSGKSRSNIRFAFEEVFSGVCLQEEETEGSRPGRDPEPMVCWTCLLQGSGHGSEVKDLKKVKLVGLFRVRRREEVRVLASWEPGGMEYDEFTA